jgi:hypothetical protein
LLHKETAPFFQVSVRSLSAAELAKIPKAKSGARLEITLKSGLPVGTIPQTIRVATNLRAMPTLDIPVEGGVVSDIRVVGGRQFFDRSKNIVTIRHPQRGWQCDKMSILVVGPHRQKVRPRVVRVTPPWMQVRIANKDQKTSVNQGRAFLYRLSITIPKNKVPQEYLTPDGKKRGEIVIETNHPDTPKIILHVQFVDQG